MLVQLGRKPISVPQNSFLRSLCMTDWGLINGALPPFHSSSAGNALQVSITHRGLSAFGSVQ